MLSDKEHGKSLEETEESFQATLHDENVRKKLDEVLRGATDALPNSVNIWHARLSHLLQCSLEKKAYAMFPKVNFVNRYI